MTYGDPLEPVRTGKEEHYLQKLPPARPQDLSLRVRRVHLLILFPSHFMLFQQISLMSHQVLQILVQVTRKEKKVPPLTPLSHPEAPAQQTRTLI